MPCPCVVTSIHALEPGRLDGVIPLLGTGQARRGPEHGQSMDGVGQGMGRLYPSLPYPISDTYATSYLTYTPRNARQVAVRSSAKQKQKIIELVI
jgi:hypothetical protein